MPLLPSMGTQQPMLHDVQDGTYPKIDQGQLSQSREAGWDICTIKQQTHDQYHASPRWRVILPRNQKYDDHFGKKPRPSTGNEAGASMQTGQQSPMSEYSPTMTGALHPFSSIPPKYIDSCISPWICTTTEGVVLKTLQINFATDSDVRHIHYTHQANGGANFSAADHIDHLHKYRVYSKVIATCRIFPKDDDSVSYQEHMSTQQQDTFGSSHWRARSIHPHNSSTGSFGTMATSIQADTSPQTPRDNLPNPKCSSTWYDMQPKHIQIKWKCGPYHQSFHLTPHDIHRW